MFSKKLWFSLHFALLSSVIGGCGILGDKDEGPTLVEYVTEYSGCLNDFGPTFRKFLNGTVAKKKWERNWDCVRETLKVLKTFVRPASDQGYTLEDIRALTANFLITEREVSQKLVASTLAVKASIVGGKRQYLTHREIDRIIKLLNVSKKETTLLIPHMWNFHNDPSAENMRAFAQTLHEVGLSFAQEFRTQGNSALKLSDVDGFLTELNRLHELELPAGLASHFLSAKQVLVAGSSQEVEPESWYRILDIVSSATGWAAGTYAYLDRGKEEKPNEKGTFTLEGFQKLSAILEKSIDWHAGYIPYSELDQLINSIPMEWWDFRRSAITDTLRPFFEKILEHRSPRGMTKRILIKLDQILGKWVKTQTQIELLFDNYGLDPLGVERDAFHATVEAHRANIEASEIPFLDRVVRLFDDFQPLYLRDTGYITFDRELLHSKYQLTQLNWIDLVTLQVVKGYGTHSNGLGRVPDMLVADMEAFIKDFGELALGLRMLDPSIETTPKRRFRDADLFTLVGNGDQKVTHYELTFYLPYILSVGEATDIIEKQITPLCTCKTEDPEQPFHEECPQIQSTLDPLKWEWMRAQCFREEYFTRFPEFWKNFPRLVEYFKYFAEKEPGKYFEMQQHIEAGARRYGFTDFPVGSYDVSSLLGLTHYIESILYRFDKDQNERLNLDEVLDANAVFARTIADLAGVSPSKKFTVKSIFTFLVKKGRPPKDGIAGVLELGWWMLKRPFWKIDADRCSVFKISSQFNKSDPQDSSDFSSLPALYEDEIL